MNPDGKKRRQAIKKAALFTTATIFSPYIWTQPRMTSRTAQKEIVIRDAGGIYRQAFTEVFYKPFMEATGIKIRSVTSGSEPTAEIMTMVKSGRPLWDMVAMADRAVYILSAGDIYLEPHGLGDDPVISSIPKQFMSPYGVGLNVFSAVLAYRSDKFKGRQAPESWKDLWDVENFPGRRCLRKHPFDTVEVALMAGGVSTENIYPCDLDKAFSSLDKIKSHITAWWTHGPHAEQLLKNDEIDLALMLTGRAIAAMKAGVPVQIAWNQHIYQCEQWAILKGSANVDLCRQFIRFASEPKRQALLAHIGVGPVQPDAFQYIPPEQQKLLPNYPDNLRKGVRSSAAYWNQAQKSVIERFNQWMIS